MSDLLGLADLCEKLIGPDREMDLAILRATSGKQWRWSDSATFEPETVITWDQYGPGAVGNPYFQLEEFTASIDDAVALIPEGFLWKLGYSRHVPHVADLTDYVNHTGRYDGVSDHSRALALCAAALRARASQLPPSNSGSDK